MATILLVDDDENFTQTMQELIVLLGHSISIADSVATANSYLRSNAVDVLLLDIMLPDGNGFDVIEQLQPQNRPRHIAFITGHSAISSLIKTVAGPDISYLLKPIDLNTLKQLLDRTLDDDATTADKNQHFGSLIGESPSMQQLYSLIERVATTHANVMIQGESGTGKELVATAIHNASKIPGPFVATNCAAISPELLASELFGHEKGSFTGAISRKIGLFEQAGSGTLFLDEITEMPIDMQSSLLRVLETGKVTRVGGTEEIPIKCRVISATNRTNQQLAEEKCLREDIYFRLAVFPIHLPPLRERKEDLPLLCQHFLQQLNSEHGTSVSMSENDALRLAAYDWPGNIRELRHTLYRAFILSDLNSNQLQLPAQLGSPFSVKTNKPNGIAAGATIQEVEKELITLTLEKVGGDKPKAADMLGISLKTLYNRLNQYEDA